MSLVSENLHAELHNISSSHNASTLLFVKKSKMWILGYHGVLSGKLHAATCTDGYFAPKVTWTHDGFKCSYQKSVCNEEGQIVVNNGSNKEDIKCRCDYNKGYGFINNPQNNCTCSPWTEDCSCHRIQCINSRFILSEGIVIL